MYNNVKTWKDLCDTNVLFIKGIYKNTFYHCAPLDNETTENTEFFNDILQLNENLIFTYNSQPTINEDGVMQKSYVSFYCEQDIGYKLLPKLLLNNDIYFYFSCISNDKPCYIDTFPTNKYNLTKFKNNSTSNIWNLYTNRFKDIYIKNNFILKPEINILAQDCQNQNINKLFNESINCMIASKDYNRKFSAPNLLLSYIKTI